MKKLNQWIIFWLFIMGLHCERPPSMHLESMDEELELQWEDLKNGYVTIEVELDGGLNPSFLYDRNESHIYIFNLTCNDVIVKDAQQSGNSHAASDDFAQMKISDVPQDPPHSNGSAYRGRGRDGVGTSADSHFMASELLPTGTLPNNGWKLFKRSSKRSHSLKIEVIPSTHEKISQHVLAVSMLSSEGFEEDEEESRAPSSKKPAPTFASQLSTPITKPTVAFPKKSPIVSNNFMNALSAVSSVNAMELQRKRKKPPPVIDLPLSSPLDSVVITPTTTTASVAGTVPPSDPLGPDPTRVSAPSARRRIHFADDNGETLVYTKLIENVLDNKAHRPNSDMKNAYAEAERISLKQMKTDADEMRMKMPEMGNIEVDSSWRLIPYYKNAQNQFSQHLIDEEEARHGNVMRTFVAQSDVPIEHPSEPDDVENAVTKFREPETIPINFAIEETVEQEPREVDAPASPDTLSANVSTVSPVTVPNFARAYLLQGTAKLTNYEVISNEAKLSLRNDIQAFTHEICYTHQIVDSAVSLPDDYLLPMNLLNMEEIIWFAIAILTMSLAMMTASISPNLIRSSPTDVTNSSKKFIA